MKRLEGAVTHPGRGALRWGRLIGVARKKRKAPLTQAMIRVLQTCQREGTTSTHQLAETLQCSPGTVRSYFQRIMKALDVQDRCDAVLKATSEGLIEPDSEVIQPGEEQPGD